MNTSKQQQTFTYLQTHFLVDYGMKKIPMVIRKYFQLNNNDNTVHQNLEYTSKALFKEKYVASNAHNLKRNLKCNDLKHPI